MFDQTGGRWLCVSLVVIIYLYVERSEKLSTFMGNIVEVAEKAIDDAQTPRMAPRRYSSRGLLPPSGSA